MKSFLISNILFVTLLTTGLVLWLISLYVQRNQPPIPNRTYGYRTSRSMKSQEAWDFSQKYSIDLLIQSAQILCAFSLLTLFVKVNDSMAGILATVLIIGFVLYPILKTEQELKKRFGP